MAGAKDGDKPTPLVAAMTTRGRPKKYKDGERRVLAVRLSTDLHKRVHHAAIDREVAVQDVVTAALLMYLARIER